MGSSDSKTKTPSPPPLRIGILGVARIARKNVRAIQHEMSNCEIVAVASRLSSKGHTFCQNHISDEEKRKSVTIFGGPTAYADLVDSTDLVDALYIPLPTCVKKEWVLRALRNNKHVLVEKPVAISAADYEEMIQVAKDHNKYIMDGTMFVHNSRTQCFTDYIAQHRDDFGSPVTRISVNFTFRGDQDFLENDIRTSKDGDLHGCIGDLAWYCVRIGQLVFRRVGVGKPKNVQVTQWKLNKSGVPIDATCLVRFHGLRVDSSADNDDKEGGVDGEEDHLLSFHCSFIHPLRQTVEVYGTKRSAEIRDFVLPKEDSKSFRVHSMKLTDCDIFAVETDASIDSVSPQEPVQEVMMWKHFCKFCNDISENGWTDGNNNEATAMSSISLENQLIVDELVKSIRQGGGLVCHDGA
jgi:predicted dehydrogenase